jgi:hypothetical protein
MTLDPKHAWQASGERYDAPALTDVRARADKFYRNIRRQNIVGYVSCIGLGIAFGRHLVVLPHILQKLGSGWMVVASFYVAWQIYRRGAAVSPEKSGGMPISAFLRMQLARQRDLLRSVLWWYILPFIPGLALVLIGNGQDPALAKHVPIWVRWVALGTIVTAFAGLWGLYQLGARRLQRRIDEIDLLMSED